MTTKHNGCDCFDSYNPRAPPTVAGNAFYYVARYTSKADDVTISSLTGFQMYMYTVLYEVNTKFVMPFPRTERTSIAREYVNRATTRQSHVDNSITFKL